VLTAEENVAYPLLLQGVGAGERRARVEEMLRLVGIQDLAHRRPQQMSGGQQQRVAVARGLVSRPRLVLADEPTGNLDSGTGGEIIHLMHDLSRGLGITFIFSTHDPAVMDQADRIVTLRDGRIEGA